MAKGLRLNIPDSWFEKVEDALLPELEAKARQVAGNIPDMYESGTLSRRDRNGRPVVLVALMHPNAALIQARYGVLTRAAAQAGVKTGRYPS